MSSSFKVSNTFTALAYTSGVCGFFCIAALVAFSLAVRFEYNHLLAPRTSSRPKQVLQNALNINTKSNNLIKRSLPYGLSWIPWALGLSYREMLEGIPMTGTRRRGHQGNLLKCNLDGIIVIKFHALLLKVALFSTVLCCGIILPMNLTAPCDEVKSGVEICKNITALDNYGMTTIGHIPPMSFRKGENSTSSVFASIVYDSFITSRLTVTVMVAWAIYLYTCYLIWNEWIENSALRRVYYLEADHYYKRKLETEDKLYLDQEEERNLPPYYSSADLRDTVPPVALYSALYKMPISDKDITKERQLEETAEVFDKCVPNPPGFSSSVAVVTLLPDPNHVSNAWKKWSHCAMLTRRLKFIQGLLEEKRQRGSGRCIEEGVVDTTDDEARQEYDYHQRQHHQHRKKRLDSVDEDGILGQQSHLEVITSFEEDEDHHHHSLHHHNHLQQQQQEQLNSRRKQRLDSVDEDGIFGQNETEIFGPESVLLDQDTEQREVYSNEYARNAACRPNGFCCENKIRNADIATLMDLEEETMELLKNAKEGLDEIVKNNIESAATQNKDLSPSQDESQDGANILTESVSARRRINQSRELLTLTTAMEPEDSPSVYSDKQELRRRTGTEFSNAADNGLCIVTPRTDFPSATPNSLATPGFEISFSPKQPWERYSYISSHREWDLANAVALNVERPDLLDYRKYRGISSGKWDCRCFSNFSISNGIPSIKDCFHKKTFANPLEQQPYAVITFTSRQAAVAARQCMADASGVERWIQVDKIPVPPLADAPTWNWLYCRGFCKPTTLTLSDAQKKGRHTTAIVFMVLFCALYTLPLTYTSRYFSSSVKEIIQDGSLDEEKNMNIDIDGLMSGILYTIFFSVCPFIFKALANYGSGASSLQNAEYKALQYYWIFILVTAFASTSLTNMALKIYDSGQLSATLTLMEVADTIPLQQSITWLNWILVRFLFVIPLNYLLNINNFLFSMIGWKCCARILSGGGSGGMLPYRIYLDSGLVFLCIVALAPASPLLAPAGLLYYVFFTPILRWALIFVYRPIFDGGGSRWPLLHHILISALVMAQVLLFALMLLKNAFGPAILAGVAVIPTLMFGNAMIRRFLHPYEDAGLLQTSQLDSHSEKLSSNTKAREDFLRWLVDCHKASFIPMCLAGKDNILTREAATVVEMTKEGDFSIPVSSSTKRGNAMLRRLSGRITPLNKPSGGNNTLDDFETGLN